MSNLINTEEGRRLDRACAEAIQRQIEIAEHLSAGWITLAETWKRDRAEAARNTLFAMRMALCGDYTFLIRLAKEAMPEIEADV